MTNFLITPLHVVTMATVNVIDIHILCSEGQTGRGNTENSEVIPGRPSDVLINHLGPLSAGHSILTLSKLGSKVRHSIRVKGVLLLRGKISKICAILSTRIYGTVKCATGVNIRESKHLRGRTRKRMFKEPSEGRQGALVLVSSTHHESQEFSIRAHSVVTKGWSG